MAQQIFTTCNPIVEECRLFLNNGRTIPAPIGFYFDGTTCWEVGALGLIVGQGTCVTTTSTTTTTTTVADFYYNVEQYDCLNSCAYVQNLIGKSTSSLTTGRFFNPGDNYVYKVISSASGPSFDVDLTGTPSSTNCNIACSF